MFRVATVAVCLAGLSFGVAVPRAQPDAVTLYDPDPGHLWNRLHAALLTRPDRDGNAIGRDSVDPHLFPKTKRLLEGPSRDAAVALLDAFLADGHKLVRDPVRRAVLQHDLWAVFDWSAYPFGNYYRDDGSGDAVALRTGPLQDRLARAVRALAPSKAEAAALPDTYALAVRAKAFPAAFDPATPNGPFLPPDLFDPTGPWVGVTGPRDMPTPVASMHARTTSGRSVFLVFIKLPAGRAATLAYLDALRSFPRPWKVPPRADDGTGRRPAAPEVSPDVPQFPAGTRVALVRQLVVVTADGTPVPTPLTESVQLRTYVDILPPERDTVGEKAQGFAELEFRRADLFAGTTGGLRANKMDDPFDPTRGLLGSWTDPFEEKERGTHVRPEPLSRRCAGCHSAGGIRGVNSYVQSGAARPTPAPGLFPVGVADARARSVEWLRGLKDWAELKTRGGW